MTSTGTPPTSLPASGTAAVVVTHNRKDLLLKCLQALLDQSAPLDRVYVVDNASTDGTAEALPHDARLMYLRLNENLGGAYGFAKGIEAALRGDHEQLWIMDDDCFPEHDALAALLPHRQENTVLCTSVVARDGRFDLNHRRSFNAVTLSERPVPDSVYERESAQVDMFTFVGVLIPTSVIQRAGLPVDNFFFMGDDSEYALRLNRLGVRTVLVPASRIWHHGSVTYPAPRGPYSDRKHYYFTRNNLIVYRRYRSSNGWFALRFVSIGLRSFASLAKHGNLNARSARVGFEALRDALLGRAYIKQFDAPSR